MAEPDHEAVRRHLDAILASPGFAGAPRLRRFLTYAVEAGLRGDAGQIKEYVLGREVFDRDDQYDPRLDPIVRVEARRLRARLSEYYASAGAAEPIRIEFPKGSYAPEIRPAAAVSAQRRRLAPSMAAVPVVAAAAAAFLWFGAPRPHADLIAVVPARWVWTEAAEDAAGGEAVAEAIAAELANGGVAGVVAWPALVRFRGAGATAQRIASETGARRVLVVSVRPPRLTAFLMDTASGGKAWVGDYLPRDLGSREGIREAARVLARELESAAGR